MNKLVNSHKGKKKLYTLFKIWRRSSYYLLNDGTIIHGANIENISYGLSNCAERSAL